jgi:Polyketide cyclase / dehydrase and lipid transport
MWFEMRKETLAFTARAPVVYACEAEAAAPRAVVFAAFTRPDTWLRWFPNVRAASYASAPPYRVGTIRHARVGHTRWVEEIIAWDDQTRWAWTVLRASVPFAVAQVEVFEFRDAPRGTRVRWTVALQPRLLARLGAPVAARTISRLLQRALCNLAAEFQARRTATTAPSLH